MLSWLTHNADAIGVVIGICAFLVSFASLAWSAWRFVAVRREEQAQKRFENYHRLIGELVGGVRSNQHMKLDSQIAVIFELRNFLEYGEVTTRILTALNEEWRDSGKPRLQDEMQRTIAALSPNKRFRPTVSTYAWLRRTFDLPRRFNVRS